MVYHIDYFLSFEVLFYFLCLCELALEGDYAGPTLEDGKITLEFMKELMETYKQQGKLHRKYAYKVSGFNTLLFVFQYS